MADRSAKDAVRREIKSKSAEFGSVLGPIIPGGTIWLRIEKRLLLGQEVLMIQGIYAGPFWNDDPKEYEGDGGPSDVLWQHYLCTGGNRRVLVTLMPEAGGDTVVQWTMAVRWRGSATSTQTTVSLPKYGAQ